MARPAEWPFKRTVHDLIGEEVSAVSFVMDYVEIHFNGMVLRSLTDPTIRLSDGRSKTFPEEGSRDALCSLIGATVAAVDMKRDQHLTLETKRGQTLCIPLDDSSRQGPEAMHFVAEGEMQIW